MSKSTDERFEEANELLDKLLGPVEDWSQDEVREFLADAGVDLKTTSEKLHERVNQVAAAYRARNQDVPISISGLLEQLQRAAIRTVAPALTDAPAQGDLSNSDQRKLQISARPARASRDRKRQQPFPDEPQVSHPPGQSMDAEDVLFDALSAMVRNGMTIDEASRRLCLIQPAAFVRSAVRRYEDLVGQMSGGPPTLTVPGRGGWYAGPGPADRFWPALRAHLLAKDWPGEDVDSLDRASSRIVSLLEHPGLARFETKGAVLGYVQSGKTANFTAVVAKGADAGYRLFVIMSGLTDKLRNQTQQRISRELHALNPQHWVMLTDSDADFGGLASGTATALLSERHDQRVLCVVKKNPSRLTRLLTWLSGASDAVLSRCPVLLIDDESDQASINTSTNPNRASTINALIRDVIQTCPRIAYVGYTATPFANVLINPAEARDLYPKDFIVDLDKPPAYFGPELVFGREPLAGEDDDVRDGLDVIRSVPISELPQLQSQSRTRASFVPTITPSLRRALLYFWLATAARFSRGQRSEHSSMLVHTTLFADVQELFKPLLETFRNSVRNALLRNDAELISEFEAIWNEEVGAVDSAKLPEALRSAPTGFSELHPHLQNVVSGTSVVIENYLTLREERLDYTQGPGVFIVVGGNILSRGLTLEGLVTSFFVRTSSAYDTLLQMGRWFGYRRGYGDLPRIWMTDELKGYFFDLATVEAEIRQDIRRYEQEQATPLDFAPRIRTHPQLAITSRLKMQHAVAASVSYSQQRPQTIHFDLDATGVLASNFSAARKVIAASADHSTVERPLGRHWLWRGVPASVVLDFINELLVPRTQFHVASRSAARLHRRGEQARSIAAVEHRHSFQTSHRRQQNNSCAAAGIRGAC